MPPIGIERYTCWQCNRTTLREELVPERTLRTWGGGAIAGPPTMEFIGSAASSSSSDPAALSVANVTLAPGERLYVSYLSDFTGPFIRVLTATWNGQQVGAIPFAIDNVTRAAALDVDGQTELWTITYNPTSFGTGTFTINEILTRPDNRLLAVFRVKNVGTHLAGDEGETETRTDPPVVLGPLSSPTSIAWAATFGLRSAESNGVWSGATRIQRVIGTTLTLDVSLAQQSGTFSCTYSGFAHANCAGTLIGYPRA